MKITGLNIDWSIRIFGILDMYPCPNDMLKSLALTETWHWYIKIFPERQLTIHGVI